MKKLWVHIVAGAPGAGKSNAVEASHDADIGFAALDMDSLLESASTLSQKDVRVASETWPPYNRMWFEILGGIEKCGINAILFGPIGPNDIDDLPAWCAGIRWFLLDCSDDVRRKRLSGRGWSEEAIRGAIADAEELRSSGIEQVLDTSVMSPPEVIEKLSTWMGSG